MQGCKLWLHVFESILKKTFTKTRQLTRIAFSIDSFGFGFSFGWFVFLTYFKTLAMQ